MQGGEIFYYSVGVCLIICMTLIFLALSTDTPRYVRARQELLCVEFLSALGYSSVKIMKKNDIWIPLFFTKKQKKENSLQKAAGFDLSKWRGYRASVYECNLMQGTARAVLYIYGEEVIGGCLHTGDTIGPLCAHKDAAGL